MRKIFLALEILYLLSFQSIHAKDAYDIDPIPLSFYTEKYQRNISLSAFGTEPNWSLDLYQNNTLELELPNHKKVHADIYAFQLDSIDQSISYFGLVENGYIQFTANKIISVDPVSSKKYSYQTELHYHDTATSHYEYLRGFATWIPNIKLESTWLLTNINEEDYLKKYQYQIFQRLKFNFQTNSISGFSGCNEFEGKFIVDNQIIEIKNIELIKNDNCQFKEFENSFLNILRSQTFQYSIENSVLKLNNSNNKLVFKSSN